MRYLIERRRLVIVIAVVVTVLLGVGVAFAVTSDSGSQSSIEATAQPQAQAVGTAIAVEIGIFDRPKTPADVLPAGIEGDSNRWLPEQRFGANGALARRARNAPLGGSVFLIPSATGVCMLNTDGTENLCATSEEVRLGDATSAILCAPVTLPTDEIEIGGIMPDGSTGVEIVLSNGKRTALTVEGNTYVADFPRSSPLPAELEWTATDGTRHKTSAHVPPGVATESCVGPSS